MFAVSKSVLVLFVLSLLGLVASAPMPLPLKALARREAEPFEPIPVYVRRNPPPGATNQISDNNPTHAPQGKIETYGKNSKRAQAVGATNQIPDTGPTFSKDGEIKPYGNNSKRNPPPGAVNNINDNQPTHSQSGKITPYDSNGGKRRLARSYAEDNN
ncbi:hypothetical protein SISSUDRAFT_1062881 [Sistotremastrum suecicum HHB10207 ss-3]|uniref:Uncharacterized protein n=1 Tax=Sistotremastrum suecicum HHB10207 ss-3 TaxID=1314776 RepID=A0A166CGC1_9AGAM|nr:hypothetical protein SISSUDRAFT_1062881 [Sistotremastrum suecicum HHB10207 ss-3]